MGCVNSTSKKNDELNNLERKLRAQQSEISENRNDFSKEDTKVESKKVKKKAFKKVLKRVKKNKNGEVIGDLGDIKELPKKDNKDNITTRQELKSAIIDLQKQSSFKKDLEKEEVAIEVGNNSTINFQVTPPVSLERLSSHQSLSMYSEKTYSNPQVEDSLNPLLSSIPTIIDSNKQEYLNFILSELNDDLISLHKKISLDFLGGHSILNIEEFNEVNPLSNVNMMLNSFSYSRNSGSLEHLHYKKNIIAKFFTSITFEKADYLKIKELIITNSLCFTADDKETAKIYIKLFEIKISSSKVLYNILKDKFGDSCSTSPKNKDKLDETAIFKEVP